MVAKRIGVVLLILAMSVSVKGFAADDGLEKGTPEVLSAGPLAFGPGGILFLGDPKSAAIFALDTGDATGDPASVSLNVPKITEKIASMLGTQATQVLIEDLAVNPASGNVYLSVSRGQEQPKPVVLKVDASGNITEFALKNVRFAKAALPNAPEDKLTGEGRRRANNRLFSITDMSYIDGRVIVAGLSNEEFASNLRAIEFPFSDVDPGSSVEIFHGNHGALETRSPIRTFVPVMLNGKPEIVAAYTCTPLVRFPLSQLKSGAKVTGTTVAELGNQNRPLDIIAYKKGGKDYLLMANNPRGMMKIDTEGIQTENVTKRVGGKAGLAYDTIESLNAVTQMDQLNKEHAVVLMKTDAGFDLQTVELP
jgi:hypothetical protein